MATISFEYDCSREAGFVMDPNEQRRFGYVTALNGFGLPKTLDADLQVHLPFNKGEMPSFRALKYIGPNAKTPMATAKVVGVLDQFNWAGGVGDPIRLEFYVSQENAMQIMALQQRALKTTDIKALGWWIADYDQEDKKWFEQAHPVSITGAITGHINGKDNSELEVDLNPTLVKTNVDVNVYKVKLAVVPAGNYKYNLHFASSNDQKVIRSWGVLIGKS